MTPYARETFKAPNHKQVREENARAGGQSLRHTGAQCTILNISYKRELGDKDRWSFFLCLRPLSPGERHSLPKVPIQLLLQ